LENPICVFGKTTEWKRAQHWVRRADSFIFEGSNENRSKLKTVLCIPWKDRQSDKQQTKSHQLQLCRLRTWRKAWSDSKNMSVQIYLYQDQLHSNF
jgi:hypothetical protein